MLKRKKFSIISISNYRKFVSSTTKIINRGKLVTNAYQPVMVEKGKYDKWERKRLFEADSNCNIQTFSMVLPPPNVTGKLHLGHALACTVQDVIARMKRSQGYNVLWLPGTDHAGIATQGIVQKYLKTKYNKDRQHMTREDFNNEVWKWKDKYGNAITQQLKILGCSLDWSRQMFTLDPKHRHAVDTAFIRLHKKGLIHRKTALVNWCNKLKSTISDIEVENITISKPTDIFVPSYGKPVKFGLLVDFTYKIYESNEDIVVSTTMPETMLGDVAIAVNPNDERYKQYHGKRVIHPFRNETIPIICDEFVDTKLGTGVVKITPAHSKIDFEVAKRHNLPLIQVIDENGNMQNTTEFNNQNKYDCRSALLEKIDNLGLLRKITSHEMTLPMCSRTGDVIDYLPKEQWFLSCSKINKLVAEVVKNNELKIEPDKFVKNWLQWTEDNRDWCITRQLWWGHQVPAYKCTSSNEVIWIAAHDEKSASIEAAKCLQTLSNNFTIERDTDVLDTWFSSGIYPFSSLSWPECNSDYSNFYPLSLMATGHDILGFWVHRMVMLGLELTESLPFNNILLHGIICDNKGAKMSKSKGNVIDPIDVVNGVTMKELEVKAREMHDKGLLSKDELQKALTYHKANFSKTDGIPECGVDALRFTLLTQDIKSHYINFDVDICHANKLFCNKIWQSIKYIELCLEKLKRVDGQISKDDLTYFDKWILSRLAYMVQVTNKSMNEYNFHIATKAIRRLIYNEYCDIYLEATKPGFNSDNPRIGYAHVHTLIAVLNVALRSLAPFMIYITEELIPKIPAFETNIVCNINDSNKQYFDLPKDENICHWRNEEFEKRVEHCLSTMLLVRQLKGFYGIPNNPRPQICISTDNKNLCTDIMINEEIFKHLTRCGDILFKSEANNRNFVSAAVTKDTIVSVEILGDNVDQLVSAAKSRLEKKIKKAADSLVKLEAKFKSDNYLSSVPEWTQELDKERILNKKEELKYLQRLVM